MLSYNDGMKATLSERGQVVIPKALRDGLGLRPGAELEITAEKGRLVFTKVMPTDPVSAVWGILRDAPDADSLLDDLRGPVDGL